MTLHILPFQWGSFKDIDETPAQDGSDEACLAEIREILLKHGKEERFGVSLLHKHFEMSDDEILLEEADYEGRRLLVRPIKKQGATDVVPTFWAFDKNQTTMGCRIICRPVTDQNGTYHPKVHLSGVTSD